jgi:hypothetical protein
MKSKKPGFAMIIIITVLCITPLAFGGPGDYLVPVTVKKADRSEIKGYIIFHEEEIIRMASEASSKGRQDPSKLLAFEVMKFREAGSEVVITYRHEKESLVTVNFFSPRGIQFTTNRLNPDVLPHYLRPGKIRWITRTGRPVKIQ